jgi:hypothetical protein
LTKRYFDVAKFTTLTPLSLLISCKFSFPRLVTHKTIKIRQIKNQVNLYSGFQGSEVWACGSLPKFQRNLLLPFSAYKLVEWVIGLHKKVKELGQGDHEDWSERARDGRIGKEPSLD